MDQRPRVDHPATSVINGNLARNKRRVESSPPGTEAKKGRGGGNDKKRHRDLGL